MTHRLTACMFALLFVAATSVDAAAPGQTVYRIEAVVSKTADDGEQRIISAPTITTVDRQAATIQVGRRSSVAIEDDEVAEVETGITCRFTPYRLKAGGVKLDLEFEVVAEPAGMDNTIVAEKFGIRRVQEIPLGVRVDVPLTAGGRQPKHRLQLKITELPPPPAEAAGVPPPPRVGRRIEPPAGKQLQFAPENLQRFRQEWEEFWHFDPPTPGAPFRTHGTEL